MEIYVVQIGDSIYTIADSYGVSVSNLIQDNGLENPNSLVPGQTIVIVYPSLTHTVEEGESIIDIANIYSITIMQLLRNNPFLSDRDYIYPGDTIVISYNTKQNLTTNGYAYPYINKKTLIKTLPYLTYLSIFNYQFSEAGEIIKYSDDTEIIKLAKDYSVIPLMMISSLSPQGKLNVDLDYRLLHTKEYHENMIVNILNTLKSSGYYGINIMISTINESNQSLYIDLLTEISNYLNKEGYLFYITINPNLKYIDDTITFEQLDYSRISQLVNGITFLQYVWGNNPGPPSPVSSINLQSGFLDYVVSVAPSEKLAIGKPLIGYDWQLPYNPNSYAYSLTLNAAINLARDAGAKILFNETSQTPYFFYKTSYAAEVIDHIVWFIDARSINSLDKLVTEYSLAGSGIWNIMVYYQQMWTMIISQYEIVKILPVA